jgi:hypothetical protein
MYKSAGYQIVVSEQSEAAPAAPEASAGSADIPVPTAGIAPPSIIVIPRSELIAFSTLPAFVVSTPAVGTVLDATSQVIAEAGEIVATADVAPEVAAQMKAGMIGTLTGPDGQQVAITVGSVGAAVPSAGEGDGVGQSASDGGVTGGVTSGVASGNDQSDQSSVVLIPADGPYSDAWLRSTVRAVVTVQVASEDSLLVPSIAVISGGNGSGRVLKRLADGSFTSVRVKEAAVLSGRSAISPEKSNELTAGDLVRVN